MPRRPPSPHASSVRKGSVTLPLPRASLTLADVQEVLSQEGYSADARKSWLKELLTDLQGDGSQRGNELSAAVRELVVRSSKPIRDKGGT